MRWRPSDSPPTPPVAASAREQLAKLSSAQRGRPQMQARLSHLLSRCSEGRPKNLTLRIDSTLDAAGERATSFRVLRGHPRHSQATTDCLQKWAPRLLRGMPSLRATIR